MLRKPILYASTINGESRSQGWSYNLRTVVTLKYYGMEVWLPVCGARTCKRRGLMEDNLAMAKEWTGLWSLD